jgi:hypothetical protein
VTTPNAPATNAPTSGAALVDAARVLDEAKLEALDPLTVLGGTR